MSSILGEELKKVLLAGIGAVAVSAEKSKEIVDELVKKGEVTVEQGKVLNEELKRKINEKKKDAQEKKEAERKNNISEILKKMEDMTPEELNELKVKLDKAEEEEE